jgi:hypothetical protein
MGIGMVIAVLGVGSTLASTITINGGPNTEFGQGVQRTVYCGGEQEITVKPISSYLNNVETATPISEGDSEHDNAVATTAPGTFYLSGIRVSEIPEECSGVDFVLSVYAADGSAPITISSQGGDNVVTPTVLWNNGTPDTSVLSLNRNRWVDPGYLASLAVENNLGAGSFTITFNPIEMNADINLVGRILIETQDDTLAGGYPPSAVVRGARVRS